MKTKRLISLLLIGIVMLTASACGKTKKVLQTKYITIDGICVDDSYKEEDNNLRRVYLFYTLNAVDKNLEADSLYTDLIFEKTNKYTSANYPKACDLAPNWYYSSYIEDVYIGEELKIIASFEIPENDLAPGRTVTLEDTQIPDAEKLRFSTDDFIHLNGFSEIAMAMDPEGYADEQ
ncbi:MAG: hypothetical protein IJ294_00060, partial [Clostridia bacterium]|nr:hypothetical protein [Clostridia bacterium]